jgi:hypothetical protein
MFTVIKQIAIPGDAGAAIVPLDAMEVQAYVHGHLFMKALAKQSVIDVRAKQDMWVE